MMNILTGSNLADENRRLKERVEELEFEVAEMRGFTDKSLLVTMRLMADFGISRSEARVLVMLSDGLQHGFEALASVSQIQVEVDANGLVRTHVARIRRKTGLSILTIWGCGYRMSQESADLVRASMEKCSAR